MQEQVKDAYTWCTLERDQGMLDEESAAHGFASALANSVESILLIPTDLGRSVHRVSIPEGASAVFFRRRSVAFHPDGNTTAGATVHCIGWKRDGENGVYLFVGEDGTTLLTDDMQAV